MRALRTVIVCTDSGRDCWRPLVDPPSRYPWSLLWRAGESSEYVRALVDCARELSRRRGWLEPAAQVQR